MADALDGPKYILPKLARRAACRLRRAPLTAYSSSHISSFSLALRPVGAERHREQAECSGMNALPGFWNLT